jgi:hypothetical protein
VRDYASNERAFFYHCAAQQLFPSKRANARSTKVDMRSSDSQDVETAAKQANSDFRGNAYWRLESASAMGWGGAVRMLENRRDQRS